MKRVKMVWRGGQDLPVERFGLVQLSALMMGGGSAQQHAEVRLCGRTSARLRFGLRDGDGPLALQVRNDAHATPANHQVRLCGPGAFGQVGRASVIDGGIA